MARASNGIVAERGFSGDRRTRAAASARLASALVCAGCLAGVALIALSAF